MRCRIGFRARLVRLICRGACWLGILLVSSATAFAAPPAAPTNLAWASSDASDAADLSWDDNSDDEDEFVFEFKFGEDGTFGEVAARPAADATSFLFTGFSPGFPVIFRIRAVNADGFSDYSNEATVTTELYQIAVSCVTVTPGGDFSKEIISTLPATIEVDGTLPEWMSWDAETSTLSGTAAPAGIVEVNFIATRDPSTRVRTLFVQVINDGPVNSTAPGAVDLALNPDTTATEMVELGSYFEDPDMGRAAAMVTPFGPINVGLYDDPVDGAPLTVANFFAYAEADRWDGTFFHRSVEKFVIQGGGFAPDGLSEGSFVRVESFDPVVNEYSIGRSNICGTIAMAKVGGDPDSATSEFFFSLKDNQSILNPQNGGFTVFGRAAGMGVVDQISAFETGGYAAVIDGTNSGLNDWPLSAITENSPLVSELASISDVVEIPTLEFSIAGGDPLVATAALVGGELTISAVGPGTMELTITATDLDGAEVAATWQVTVSNSYASWAAAIPLTGEQSEPGDNRDGGTLSNLQEYAFGGDPTAAGDDIGGTPVLDEYEDSETEEVFDAITFRQRKFAPDLSYRVMVSTDLATWTELWKTADGTDATPVAVVEDEGEFEKLTVRRPDAQSAGGVRYFFRVELVLEVPE